LNAAVEANRLYRFFHAGDEEVMALRGVDLRVERGDFVVVTGPSGSGKSTLLSCVAGLDDPDGGVVFIDGERMSRRTQRERAGLRGRSVGVLFQAHNLITHLTVGQNVALAQKLGGNDRTKPSLLAQLGLSARVNAFPSELSGGEAVRAGLAVALSNDPAVLVADEPTGELDATTEADVLDLLSESAARGCALLVASHSPAVAAVATRTVTLSDGVVVPREQR